MRSYEEVVYPDLFENIDLSYRVTDTGLKYEFVLRPGADPSDISITYEGVETVAVYGSGLAIRTSVAELRDTAPIGFQQPGREVGCSFVLRGSNSIGFICEPWDRSRSLVIDPLLFSTYLGGFEEEIGFSVSSGPDGSTFVAGVTTSVDFPVSPGAFDGTYAGEHDVFVAKLGADGSALQYATYVGGSKADWTYSLIVDAEGSAFVTGATLSPDFPTTPGAFDRTYNGGGTFGGDAFVIKLNESGEDLVFGTFLGGSSDDYLESVALDSQGNIVVTGESASSDFPTTPGAFDTSHNGLMDMVVAKLGSSGSSLVFSTFVGGVGFYDWGRSIALDSDDNVYVTGFSNSANFPTTPGAFDTSINGGDDGVLFKLSPSGSSLIYSTFLGGSEGEQSEGLSLDADGNAYVTGVTESPDFPVTMGAFDTTLGSNGDAFVAKLNSSGTVLAYSTFLGGTGPGEGWDWAFSIAVDREGGAYATGWTECPDFPVTSDAADTTFEATEAFLVRLTPLGDAMSYSTFLGGSDTDRGDAVSIDAMGDVVLLGSTRSRDFPTTAGAYDTSHNGASDTFLVKLGVEDVSPNTPPRISTFSSASALEGSQALFTASAFDAEGDLLTYAFDFESDSVYDLIGPNSNVSHVYGDDFGGVATLRVSDGEFSVYATTPVAVGNVPPALLGAEAHATVSVTLRVAGERWHNVNLTVVGPSGVVGSTSVTRLPGSPDDQSATIEGIDIDLLGGTISAEVRYTPRDDPEGGQSNGANPSSLILAQPGGMVSWIQHTFNAQHPETWNWTVPDVRLLLAGFALRFKATAYDPGSDDLTFAWSWGGGTPNSTTTYYNDGVGPDQDPSTNVNPIAATDEVWFVVVGAGTYTLTLVVRDDDGGDVRASWSVHVG